MIHKEQKSIYIHSWYAHIQEDGILYEDNWLWKSVQKALLEYAQSLGKTFHDERTRKKQKILFFEKNK